MFIDEGKKAFSEIVTQKMSSTKLKSPLQTRKKRTSDFVTLLLNYDTETICVHSVMSATNTLPNLVSTYGGLKIRELRMTLNGGK